MDGNTLIYCVCYKYDNWRKAFECIEHKGVDDDAFNDISRVQTDVWLLEQISNGYKVLSVMDEDYPKDIFFLLNEDFQPPFIIFYKGSVDTVKNRILHLISEGWKNNCSYYYLEEE